MKPLNHKDYVRFALIVPIEGNWSFTGYSDRAGNTYRAIRGYTNNNVPRSYEVYWSAAERVTQTPANKMIQVLKNGIETQMKLVDYIFNSPNCQDSPNNTPEHPILFKLIDEQKDAAILVDRRKRKNEALNKAFSLEGQDLVDIAALYGDFRSDPVVLMERVTFEAGRDPERFLKFYDSPDRAVRALVRKGLSLGKLTKIGESIFWGKEAIGGTEELAVSELISNPEKMRALQDSIAAVPQDNLNVKKKVSVKVS